MSHSAMVGDSKDIKADRPSITNEELISSTASHHLRVQEVSTPGVNDDQEMSFLFNRALNENHQQYAHRVPPVDQLMSQELDVPTHLS